MNNEEKIRIAVVCGPTASGKTALAVGLAKLFDGEVVSADSMQIYKGMDIASAKPAPEEMQGIPHHLLSFVPPDKAFSVADYLPCARKAVADIASRGKLPIVCGGTGLYISSLVDNIEFDDTGRDEAYRQELYALARERGNAYLKEMLMKADPDAASKLHENNLKRIIRALEVCHISGHTMSEAVAKSRENPSPYLACMMMIDWDREYLYRRINDRVDEMIALGLIDEAREFFTHPEYVTSAQAIGYKELKPYLDGDASLEEATEKLKRETRRYAKRQLTWFNKDSRITHICVSNLTKIDKIIKIAENLLKNYSFL